MIDQRTITVREQRAERLANATLDFLSKQGNEHLNEWLATTSWSQVRAQLKHTFLEILP